MRIFVSIKVFKGFLILSSSCDIFVRRKDFVCVFRCLFFFLQSELLKMFYLLHSGRGRRRVGGGSEEGLSIEMKCRRLKGYLKHPPGFMAFTISSHLISAEWPTSFFITKFCIILFKVFSLQPGW